MAETVPSTGSKSFNALVEQFLGSPPPAGLADEISLSGLASEARGFIRRMLTLMKRAAYPVTEFNPFLIRALTTFVPDALPSAWQGRIPPITGPGRHRKLDNYIARHARPPRGEQPVFIDVACGFPPVTVTETARNLPDWTLFGVDRTFSPYILYIPGGHYACFNRNGEFQYLQTQMTAGGRMLNDDPETTRSHFKTLFAQMHPLLQPANGPSSTLTEKDGNKLIRNHIHDYEADNLSFIEADIHGLDPPPARAI